MVRQLSSEAEENDKYVADKIMLKMKSFTFGSILLTFLFIVLGASCVRQDRNHSSKEEPGHLVELGEMEVNLRAYYLEIEEKLRIERGIKDQNTIDIMMQLFIDEGDIDAPFVVERREGIPEITYVTYLEYKKYYSRPNSIDTTKTFSVYFDSLGQITDSDTIR